MTAKKKKDYTGTVGFHTNSRLNRMERTFRWWVRQGLSEHPLVLSLKIGPTGANDMVYWINNGGGTPVLGPSLDPLLLITRAYLDHLDKNKRKRTDEPNTGPVEGEVSQGE